MDLTSIKQGAQGKPSRIALSPRTNTVRTIAKRSNSPPWHRWGQTTFISVDFPHLFFHLVQHPSDSEPKEADDAKTFFLKGINVGTSARVA